MSTRRSRPSLPGVSLAVAGALIGCAVAVLGGEALLFLAPALMLAGVLLARRYPGERLLARLAARPRRHRSRAGFLARRPTARRPVAPRGGLLLGLALAVRPPPHPAG